MSVFEQEDQQTVKLLAYGFLAVGGLTVALIVLAAFIA